jgi:CRP-like cAMP-binding protein
MQFQKVHGQILKKHHLFTSLSQDEFQVLFQSARLLSAAKGDYIFQQGDHAHNFFFVSTGRIKLFRTLPDGNEKVIELISEESSFAEALMFMEQEKYPVSACALESSELIIFNSADYLRLLDLNPRLTRSLLSDFCIRLHRRLDHIEMLSLKNSTHRVARYLLSLCLPYPQEQPSFELPIAKRLIAGFLAIQPETLSRIIASLKEQGLIEMEGKVVTILDRKGLEAFQ